MANTSSNARIVELDGNTEIVVFSPNIQIMYNPVTETASASFGCSNYLFAANSYHQIQSPPNGVFVDMANNMSTCYGNGADPVTGIDLSKVSVAGVMVLFQSAFDIEYNKKNIQTKLNSSDGPVANNGTEITANVSISGSTAIFSGIATPGTGLSITNWGWMFGDGICSLEAGPVHAYSVPGDYTAIFMAMDSSNTVVSVNVSITIPT